MRMQIQPGLVWAWRAPGRLQIGLDPEVGAVIDGLTTGDERLLDALDGGGSDLGPLLRLARRAGVGEARARELLDALSAAGVLVQRHTPKARLGGLSLETRELLRASARTAALTYPGGDGWDVVAARRARLAAVVGLGPTGLAVALGLARSGVGTVLPVDEERVTAGDVRPGGFRDEDVGRRRQAAAADLLHAAMPQVRTSARTDARPDLVVATRTGALDASRFDGMLREDVVHLAVLLRERDAVVGPLVRPGRSPCLRCLDLHRRDRDPEWPRVVPQVAARRWSGGEEPVLSGLASALAVAQGLVELDRRVEPVSLGATLEVGLPDGLVGVRDWASHPECGCTALPTRSAPLPRAASGALLTR